MLGLAPSAAGIDLLRRSSASGDASSSSRQTGNNVQIVFQNPYGSLNPAHTIGSAVGEPLERTAG
ncbi:MAG: hypothetical protein R2705_19375 [Ilumatobacteraceae bacterium]